MIYVLKKTTCRSFDGMFEFPCHFFIYFEKKYTTQSVWLDKKNKTPKSVYLKNPLEAFKRVWIAFFHSARILAFYTCNPNYVFHQEKEKYRHYIYYILNSFWCSVFTHWCYCYILTHVVETINLVLTVNLTLKIRHYVYIDFH